jgi:hypothetical protein
MIRSTETLGKFYVITWRHIPEDNTLHNILCDNLKSKLQSLLIRSKICDDGTLIKILRFWTLSIVLFSFNTTSCFCLKLNVSETGLCLHLQVKPAQLGPIERTIDNIQKHNICIRSYCPHIYIYKLMLLTCYKLYGKIIAHGILRRKKIGTESKCVDFLNDSGNGPTEKFMFRCIAYSDFIIYFGRMSVTYIIWEYLHGEQGKSELW